MAGWLTVGCGPTVNVGEDGAMAGSTSAANDETDDGGSPSASDETAGPPGGSTGVLDEGTSGADGTTAAAASSTGEDWLFGPGAAWSQVSCNQAKGEISLLVELYIDPPTTACIPDPAVDLDDLLVLGSNVWDGSGGVFPIGDNEMFRGSGPGLESIVGTIEITVSEPYFLDTIFLDVLVLDQAFVGAAELSTCSSGLPRRCEAP
ncbi:MAG: hypothetical protein AAF721_36085 [Myxococcota bacterium]